MFLRKILLVGLILTATPTFPQTTKEQQKLAEKQRKEEKKRVEREEKDRLKRPAEIQINASAEKVGARIVQSMNRYNYQIAEEGKYRLVFTQEVTGFRGSLASGLAGAIGPPLRTVTFTISQIGETTTVSADLSIQFRKAFGRVDRTNMNKNKEWRRDVDTYLKRIKIDAETVE